jgi:hypothetical protein
LSGICSGKDHVDDQLRVESIATWRLTTSVVTAPIRLATNRSMSGLRVRSFLATMYQLGFERGSRMARFAAGFFPNAREGRGPAEVIITRNFHRGNGSSAIDAMAAQDAISMCSNASATEAASVNRYRS